MWASRNYERLESLGRYHTPYPLGSAGIGQGWLERPPRPNDESEGSRGGNGQSKRIYTNLHNLINAVESIIPPDEESSCCLVKKGADDTIDAARMANHIWIHRISSNEPSGAP